MELSDNEIICQAQRVKYHSIEYHDGYVTIEQHRTRRRVPAGYYFDDNGVYIYVSTFYSHLFQHKAKIRYFALNTETKEWRYGKVETTIEEHVPNHIEVKGDSEPIQELKR